MKEHLKTGLATALVTALGSLALGNAGLLALPDVGGGGSAQPTLALASLAPRCTETGAESRALRERRLIESLEALGLAVD